MQEKQTKLQIMFVPLSVNWFWLKMSDSVSWDTIFLCKAKRQYLLTCKASGYFILALHGRLLYEVQVVRYCIQRDTK